MNTDPAISVVIPAFNRAHVINKAITSVLSQTFKDYEIIVIDDGSTDNTQEVVKNIKDGRIHYLFQENGGGSKARNTGIDAARGKYIAFLDSDDVFLPHHLVNAFPVLESGDNICTYTQVIVDRGQGINFLKPPRGIRHDENISEYLMCDRGFVQTSSLIVPTKLARQVKYDEKIKAGQDYDFAIRLVHSGAQLEMLSASGAIWNDQPNPNRLSSRGDPDERCEWLMRLGPMVTKKAFFAEMGWPIAKAYARNGRLGKATILYFRALFTGCYRPKLAVVIFLQIFIPPSWYRSLSDFLASIGVKP